MRLLWLCVLVPQCHCSFSGEAPYFKANTTIGHILGAFSSPIHWTLPQCVPQSLAELQSRQQSVKRKVNNFSFYSVGDHLAWKKGISAYCDEPTEELPFPSTDDKNGDIALLLGLPDPAERGERVRM
jgi:1-Cys peroxiredoxin 6